MSRDPSIGTVHTSDNDRYLWFSVRATTLVDRLVMRRTMSQLKPQIDQVERWCLFIGYPRSGHSLVGSFIDAHPDALVSHRLDAVKQLANGLPAEQVVALMIRNSERFGRNNRKLTGYSYPIEGQWQGRSRRLRVVGDQEANWTTRQLAADPDLAAHLAGRPEQPVQFLHVVRNPFDNITTWASRRGFPLDEAIDHYFALCDGVARIRERVPQGAVLDIHHEEMVGSTVQELRRVLEFLELEEVPGYVEACGAIVFRKPHLSRTSLVWTAAQRAATEDRMKQYPWLSTYHFESA